FAGDSTITSDLAIVSLHVPKLCSRLSRRWFAIVPMHPNTDSPGTRNPPAAIDPQASRESTPIDSGSQNPFQLQEGKLPHLGSSKGAHFKPIRILNIVAEKFLAITPYRTCHSEP